MSRATDCAGPDPPAARVEPRGWAFVWALSAAQLVSWGVLYYGFSLFVVPMEAELGWSRTALNGALSLGLLAAGVAAFPVGAWIDRHGGRSIMTGGSLLGALMLAAWSQVGSLVAFYAIWIGMGVAMAATLYEPAFVVLTRRFAQSYRTKITIMTLVGGLASTVFMPLTQVLIGAIGWRAALLTLAAVVAAACVTIHALVLREAKPVRSPAAPGAAPAASSGAVRRAMQSPVFWGLVVCFTAYYASFTAVSFHLVPLLTDRGVPMEIVVGAIAVIGPAQVAGRVALLTLGRRLHTATIGRLATAAFPASVLILLLVRDSTAALFAFAACLGTANGVMTILRGTAVPDLLTRDSYGAVNGALAAPSTGARAVAPFAAALIWSAGGYDTVLWTVVACGVVAVAAFDVAARRRAAPDPAA